MLPSLEDYLHLKKLRGPSIRSRNTMIKDLQSDWTSGTTGHTQTEIVVSHDTFED